MRKTLYRIYRETGYINSNVVVLPYGLAATYYLYTRIFAGIPAVEPIWLFETLIMLQTFCALLAMAALMLVLGAMSLLVGIVCKDEIDRETKEEKFFFAMVTRAVFQMPASRREHYFNLVSDALDFDHSGDF